MENIAEQIEAILVEGQTIVCLRTFPEVLDFTKAEEGQLFIATQKGHLVLNLNRFNIKDIFGLLSVSIFDRKYVQNIITYNFKSLISYLKFFSDGKSLLPHAVLDLQVVENFLHTQKKAPENFREFIDRSRQVASDKSWKLIYQKLLHPLLTQVIPSLETFPLLHLEERKAKYAFYDIEGQANGRLRCMKKFSEGFVPHTLGAEEKKVLRPRGYNKDFLYVDVKYCEVSVLQILSQDPVLSAILFSEEDLYRSIYKTITGDECDSDKKRQIAKDLFLMVVYGSGAKTLAERLKISINVASELIDRIYKRFPIAMNWIIQKTEEAKVNGFTIDYFSRKRNLAENESYLARNSVVQGPAATVCLEKLVQIHKVVSSNLCFSVHDGYGLVCDKDDVRRVNRIVNDVVKTESELIPGLKLRCESKFGPTLDQLIKF
jgi:hypothetical protein